MAIEHESMRKTAKGSVTESFLALLTLSFWQIQQVKLLFALATVGIVAAVVLVDAIPIFTSFNITVSARAAFTNQPYDPSSSLQATINRATDSIRISQMLQQVEQDYRQSAAPFFDLPPDISLHLDNNFIYQGKSALPISQQVVEVHGYDIAHIASHVQLQQGRLPRSSGTATATILEVAMTANNAAALNARLGSTYTIYIIENPITTSLKQNSSTLRIPVRLQVVGILHNQSDDAFDTPFWHGDNLNYQPAWDIGPANDSVVASNTALLALFDQISAQSEEASLVSNANISLYFPLDIHAITDKNIGQLQRRLDYLTNKEPDQLSNNFTSTIAITNVELTLMNNAISSQTIVVKIPLLAITGLMLGLILFFVTLMTDLLVTRQAEAISIMRSRGATAYQIFAAFLSRTLLINGIALLTGMALTIPVVILLTHLTLQPEDQGGLSLFTEQPLQTFRTLVKYALGSSVITQLAMSLALLQTMRTDVLALRKEMGRATRKPFWQRLYLDIIGIMIVLAASGFSLYLTKTTITGSQINVLVKAPLVLTATICLVITCILLLLRLFPFLLRLGTRLALHNQGVEPMLALSHMARTPRRSLHTALLLLLNSAFVVFVVVFAASQNQHLDDVAQYWAGTDFSGSFSVPLSLAQAARTQRAYQHIKGMSSVTLGDVEMLTTISGETTIKMMAVDPQRFLQTVDWSEIGTHVQQRMLIATLQDPVKDPQLESAWINAPAHSIPALVDAHLWQALQLTPGQSFLLSSPIGPISFFAVQEVKSIPTIHDQEQETQDLSVPSGILVDFKQYNVVYHTLSFTPNKPNGESASINAAWLKTDGKAQSLQRVRQIVEVGPLRLDTFYDRQASAQTLVHNPLSLNLVGILVLGTIAPLLLTWIGCLLASWIDIRQRHLLFGVLRALGSTPGQIARVLAWEQGLIFGTAIVLGMLFGLLTAFLALPSLVLTSVLPHLSSSNAEAFTSEVQDLFSLQNIPPAQTIVPQAMIGVVILLVGLGMLTVVLMTRSASRLALAQTLRRDED